MAGNLLNLPINIPWKQIAVSPDMMDDKFCNKLFPFAWRSSMAISVYEPDPDDLPEELCGDRITYLKITTTITGYQPTKEDIEDLEDLIPTWKDIVPFPDNPTEDDLRSAIDRITADYFACYGVLLNVAIFPYPNTKKELVERSRIDFANLQIEGSPPLGEGEKLPNPLKHVGITFEATGQQANELIDIIQLGEGTDAELNLFKQMEITLDGGYAAIEAKLVCANSAGVKMEAFSSGKLVGTEETEAEPDEVVTLLIEAEDIDRVVITAPENKASLLEFAWYGAREVSVELEDYPHVIDFEPKTRDLYQGATESGEILTASVSEVHTDKSFTNTKTSETGLDFSATFGPPKVSVGEIQIEPKEEFTGTYSRKWGQINQDQTSIQSDASRERRETQGTTTQLSQMYNLLTGYHAGTNRAVLLMLPRPHILQPTDFRTFVQGLRMIEGMQEFFLIVARPEGIDGLCIETSLETGHFPEDTMINEPPPEYEESSEEFVVTARSRRSGARSIEESLTSKYTIESGWVIDRSKGDAFHEGIEFLGLEDNDGNTIGNDNDTILGRVNANSTEVIRSFNYQAVDDGTIQVVGRVQKLAGKDKPRHVALKFKVHTRREQPKKTHKEASADVGRLLITSRGLCTCFKSGDCPEVVSVSVPLPPEKPPKIVEHIVDEPMLRMSNALLTTEAASQSRLPAMKEFLRGIRTALTTSFRSPKRYPLGEVGFLESDYFKDEIKKLLPERYLQTPLGRVRGLPDEVTKALGDDLTIDQALKMDLARFVRRTGLSVAEAAKARQRLLGLVNDLEDDVSSDSAQGYDEK